MITRKLVLLIVLVLVGLLVSGCSSKPKPRATVYYETPYSNKIIKIDPAPGQTQQEAFVDAQNQRQRRMGLAKPKEAPMPPSPEQLMALEALDIQRQNLMINRQNSWANQFNAMQSKTQTCTTVGPNLYCY